MVTKFSTEDVRSVSATEIPVLDPKNLVVGPINPEFNMRSSSVFDFAAKTSSGFGSQNLEHEDFFICLRAFLWYVPELEPRYLEGANWEHLYELEKHKAKCVSELYARFTARDDLAITCVKRDGFTGIGFDSVFTRYPAETQDNPDYIFWPEHIRGGGQAIGRYFLHCILHLSSLDGAYTYGREKGVYTNHAVAIDNILLDHFGKNSFPFRDRMNEEYTIILRGE
jgi:hypothetical protein